MISGKDFVINNRFSIGDLVYVVTDPDQYACMVTAIKIVEGGRYLYNCSCGTASNQFYEMELSAEPNIELKIK